MARARLKRIYPIYAQFIKLIAEGERVNINVADEAMRQQALGHVQEAGADLTRLTFFIHPTNDAWCRDHGPAFLINPAAEQKKMVVDWGYNAWGGKYPPFDLDDDIPTLVAQHYRSSGCLSGNCNGRRLRRFQWKRNLADHDIVSAESKSQSSS